jgi:8-oxo-dGTP pyrophosphatase MutT (NUDIX family)
MGVPDRVFDSVPPEAEGWPKKKYAAAGGVVARDGLALVLLRRNGEVRLPKGHVEKGETAAECAVREVAEETGLRAPRVVSRLGEVENRYAFRGKRYKRRETWFLMAADDARVSDLVCEKPDEPERCWRPAWRPFAEAEAALTYEAERLALRWAVEALRPAGPDGGLAPDRGEGADG